MPGQCAVGPPSTTEALLGVPGIGPAKLGAYGDELINLMGLEQGYTAPIESS